MLNSLLTGAKVRKKIFISYFIYLNNVIITKKAPLAIKQGLAMMPAPASKVIIIYYFFNLNEKYLSSELISRGT